MLVGMAQREGALRGKMGAGCMQEPGARVKEGPHHRGLSSSSPAPLAISYWVGLVQGMYTYTKPMLIYDHVYAVAC